MCFQMHNSCSFTGTTDALLFLFKSDLLLNNSMHKMRLGDITLSKTQIIEVWLMQLVFEFLLEIVKTA